MHGDDRATETMQKGHDNKVYVVNLGLTDE